MPDIVPVATARQRRQFVELPYSLYAGHPHWVPPLQRDERRRLSPGHNAFLAHAEMDLWLATANGLSDRFLTARLYRTAGTTAGAFGATAQALSGLGRSAGDFRLALPGARPLAGRRRR